MKLFFLHISTLLVAMNLFSMEKTWESAITNVKGRPGGYDILFSIPEYIKASFADGTKFYPLFVPDNEVVGDTAQIFDYRLVIERGVVPVPFIRIDGEEPKDISWNSIITEKKRLFDERKNDATLYVPTIEVVVDQYDELPNKERVNKKWAFVNREDGSIYLMVGSEDVLEADRILHTLMEQNNVFGMVAPKQLSKEFIIKLLKSSLIPPLEKVEEVRRSAALRMVVLIFLENNKYNSFIRTIWKDVEIIACEKKESK